MGLEYFITLIVGIILGAWAASYSWNRYYRTDLWNARKAVMLEQLLAQRKKAEVDWNRSDLEISRMLDERLGEKK